MSKKKEKGTEKNNIRNKVGNVITDPAKILKNNKRTQ